MNSSKSVAVIVIVVLALSIGFVLPNIVGPYLMRLVIFGLIYSLLALALNLSLGFRGEISLGHQTFFGFGAYVAAILATSLNFSLLLILPIAAALTAIVGFQ